MKYIKYICRYTKLCNKNENLIIRFQTNKNEQIKHDLKLILNNSYALKRINFGK